MRVIRAACLGLCFGVRDALKMVEQLPNPNGVTIHGELVHNEAVQQRLLSLGFRFTPERSREIVPATPRVVLTAHGVSDRERQRLLAAGKELIDTTCPLVRRVHDAACLLQRQGYFVVILGKPGHVEVEGIVGDLDAFAVVHRLEDVGVYSSRSLGVVCQSTTPPRDALRLLRAIQAHNPGKEIRFIDTICRPTRERQYAALALLRQVDALVVVGGRNSHNTRQLVQLAAEHGIPAVHVQTPDDLESGWFRSFQVVGLTAGTSTLDAAVDAVHAALLRLNQTTA